MPVTESMLHQPSKGRQSQPDQKAVKEVLVQLAVVVLALVVVPVVAPVVVPVMAPVVVPVVVAIPVMVMFKPTIIAVPVTCKEPLSIVMRWHPFSPLVRW